MTPTIAVDAMGGDRGLSVTVPAVLEVCRESEDISVVLVGKEREIRSFLSKEKRLPSSLSIVNADDVVYDSDDPVAAYREKSDSSLHIGLELLKDRHADAFFTIGNTGAAVLAAHFICDYLPGVTRAPLATIFPTLAGTQLFLLDLGATLDRKPELLADFARLGSLFCHAVTGKSYPTVKLLNVGVEDEKGPLYLRKAAALMGKNVRFGGFIEGNHLFRYPNADVVVMDGFTGNILLKTMEGLAKTTAEMLEKHTGFGTRFFQRRLVDRKMQTIMDRFNYAMYGTAVLLGFRQLIGIGHGRSQKDAVKSAIVTLAARVSDGIVETLLLSTETPNK